MNGRDRLRRPPEFQHRHFVFLADVIADLSEEQRPQIAQLFAERLRSTNPRFDVHRFLEACQGE